MPRLRKTVPAADANSLVASVARMRTNRPAGLAKPGVNGAWQEQAWTYYDITGELRFASTWKGAALSRVRLYAAERDENGKWAEIKDAGNPAVESMNGLFGGSTGHAQMLNALGVHLTVTGEAYLIAYEDDEGDEVWQIVSTSEISYRAGRWSIDRGGDRKQQLPEDALVLRIWRPHPKRYIEPDSPVRALLPVLRELEQLTKHVGAQVDSRLAGAGLLLLPQEMSFAAAGASDPQDPQSDPFLTALAEAMLTPIEDRENAAAVVPIVVRAPAEHLDKATHLSFSTDLDKAALELRTEAIRRLALGLEMPPEILLGTGDISHWSAWAVEESAIKFHIADPMELITDALTTGFHRPALEALDVKDPQHHAIRFDMSELRLRPNRAQEALQVHDRGGINNAALRRETGFGDEDALTDEGYARWVLQKVATGNPNLALDALRALGITITATEPQGNPNQGAVPIRSGVPEGVDPENRELPALEPPAGNGDGRRNGLNAAAELLVHRAMERAGNRLRAKRRLSRTQVEPAQAHLHSPAKPAEAPTLLEDAWEHVPVVAESLDVPADWLQARLDSYCTELLCEGRPHDPARLADLLVKESAHA